MVNFSLIFVALSTISTVLCESYAISEKNCIITKYSQVSEVTHRCNHIVIGNLSVPAGKTLTLSLKTGSTLLFNGTVSFEHKVSFVGPLILITGTNITVEGSPGSFLNGNGPLYWDGKGVHGSKKPYFMHILAKDSRFKNINVLNCPKNCIYVIQCDNVVISGWTIDNSAGDPGVAPKGHEGHNTDGFDIHFSTNLIVENSTVYAQDDCVAVNSGHNMIFRNLYCHGSHGLSLSVGHNKQFTNYTFWSTNDNLPDSTVVNITLENSIVVDSDNGLHVKTKPGIWRGEVTDITYRNIRLSGIRRYGIYVHEDYDAPGHPQNNIPITNLVLENVTGTVQGKKAIPVYILCAKNGCFNWKWSGVRLTHENGKGKPSSCNFLPKGFDCK